MSRRRRLEDSVRTNAFGPLLLTQALAPQLADGATVANLSSMMASLSTRTEFRAPSYCISKAAQNMATVLLAKALAPRGIKVVALSPGWVQTDMGGDGAEITAAQSAAGLLQVIDALTPAQSGAVPRLAGPGAVLVARPVSRCTAGGRPRTPIARWRAVANQALGAGTIPA